MDWWPRSRCSMSPRSSVSEGMPTTARAVIEPGGLDLTIEPVAYAPSGADRRRRPGQPVPPWPGPLRGGRRSPGDRMDRVEPARPATPRGSSVGAVRLSLQPSLDPSAYRFVHHLRTRFAETDAMGIIHHGTYPVYLEEARAAMLRDAGFPYEEVRAGDAGIDFAVLELLRAPSPAPALRRPGGRPRGGRGPDPHHLPGRATCSTSTGETRATAVTVHGAVDANGSPVADAGLPGRPHRTG